MSARVGVIGTGWADRVLIPAFQAGGVDVAAVASRDPARARSIADRHGVASATGSWRDLLDMDVDVVVVTSAPAYHVEQVTAVLASGRHVLCEKPLGVDVASAEAIAAAARGASGRLALVDHELRFTPARRKARELIRSGAIGRVVTVTARVANRMRVDPTRPWTWWSDVAQGGGILGALGCHVLDSVRWLLDGEIDLRGASLGRVYPTRLDADGVERTVTAEDIASLTFKVGDVVGTALLHGAALDDAIDLFTVRGTEGSLVIDRSLKLYFGKRGGPLKEYLTPLPAIVPNRFRASGFAAGSVLFAEALGRALGGDAAALEGAADVEDGLAVQRAIDRARRLDAAPPAPGS
ncbi:MAG: Gfo/Idh/MocA family oxidoreductase [Deinococcales bacterium]